MTADSRANQRENFGTLLQMEVGAMLVGQIENNPGNKTVARGQEKGHFAFGGSTVILMTQKGRVRFLSRLPTVYRACFT